MVKKWGKYSGGVPTVSQIAMLDPNISTEQLYGGCAAGEFTETYAEERSELDYKYHTTYTLERQMLQDRIVDSLVPRRVEQAAQQRGDRAPSWLLFSAGAMGAGKTRTLHWMSDKGHFPLQAFVFLDHDAIRYMLPEMWFYQQFNPDKAGVLTQREAGYIVELATRRCIRMGVNCLVDGSLRDAAWYQRHIPQIRESHPMKRFGILHVHADAHHVMRRAREREKITGRRVPEEVLRRAIDQVPRSVQDLSPLVDFVARIDNSGALPPRLDSVSFPVDSRLAEGGVDVVDPSWNLVRDVLDSSDLSPAAATGMAAEEGEFSSLFPDKASPAYESR
eukprot:TRINITY_DN33028_c0_g1_i1.p1 TRINITY_DN33028_c0_g1~~TRINITY_DN33028_c0_g1_i1.p1  ORF type:complete len:379 (+),score=97.39 TRINITY_DN33028_c0_g1_i1:137-1138(+)